jgi:hypothetical protein
LGNLPVGGTATVSISASAMTISIMTNIAAVSSYEIDLQPLDNRVVLPTRVALFTRATALKRSLFRPTPRPFHILDDLRLGAHFRRLRGLGDVEQSANGLA